MFLNLHLVVLFPFLLAVLTLVLGRRLGRHLGWALVPFPLACALYLLSLVPRLLSHSGESFSATWNWVPSLGLSFSLHLDGFSLLFALLISGIGSPRHALSIYYLDRTKISGAFTSRFFSLWGRCSAWSSQRTSSPFTCSGRSPRSARSFSIGFWHDEVGIGARGALKSMLVTVAGGLSCYWAIVFTAGDRRRVVSRSGSWSEKSACWSEGHPYYPAIVLLILLGLLQSQRKRPFHLWLPGAMAAPTPVSASFTRPRW